MRSKSYRQKAIRKTQKVMSGLAILIKIQSKMRLHLLIRATPMNRTTSNLNFVMKNKFKGNKIKFK